MAKKAIASKKSPVKKSSGKKGPSSRVAAQWGVALPERLIRFFDSEKSAYEGRSIFGMKGFGGAVKMPLRFGSGALPAYADYALSMTGIAPSKHLPLAQGGKDEGTYFVAVDLSDPKLPVHFFDYESGFAPYAADFDSFLKSGLLKKGEKTPSEQLHGHYAKANALYKKKKFAAAAALLEKALVGVPDEPSPTYDEFMDVPGNAVNILGCCKEELGKIDEAVALFGRAVKMGCHVAGLNLLRRFKERGEWAKVVEYGEPLRARLIFSIAEYEWFWTRHYLGQAYLALGDVSKAVVCYHQIRKGFLSSDVDKIKEAADTLRKLVKARKPGADAAAAILAWFDPPPTPIDDARRAKLHAFWEKVPAGARGTLLEKVGGGKPGKKAPADEVLDRILRLDAVKLRSIDLGDAAFLKDFDLLKDADLEGCTFSSLETIASLQRLTELDLGKTGLASLKPLASLTRLEKLDCSENRLESLDGVQSMKRLQKLRVNQNAIRDLGPLAGLPELEDATVYNNPIADLSPLASCPRLREISSFGLPKGVKGLTSLKVLPNLEKVDASDAPKADVEALREVRPDIHVSTYSDSRPARRVVYERAEVQSELAWLKERGKLGSAWKKILEKIFKELLDGEKRVEEAELALMAEGLREDSIWANKRGLTSLAPLTHFKAMDYLCIDDNRLTDLSPLSGHAWLESLLVRRNQLTSLAPLATLKRLGKLYCDGNLLESLAGLEPVVTLRELYADDNRLTNLAPLRNLVELRELAVVGNRISSLEPLSGLKKLRELYAYGNAFRDLSPLAGCAGLQVVECFVNPGLRGLLALKDLPELRKVVSHGALPADEIREFSRLRPEVVVD